MTATTVRHAFVLSLSTALFVAAGTDAGMRASAQTDNAIVMSNFAFTPMAITVPSGTTVSWTNKDGEPHTVTSLEGLFRSGALDTGESFKFKFAKAGVYKYTCSIHPRMTGTVTVK
jgi:plastocyanin